MPRPHRVLVVWSLVLGLLGLLALDAAAAGAAPRNATGLTPGVAVPSLLEGGLPPVCPDGPTVPVDFRAADGDPGTPLTPGCTDPDGDPLTYVVDTAPQHGTLDLTNPAAPVYKAALDFSGTDAVSYHANDGALDSETRTATFHVDQPPACDPVPGATVDKNSASGVVVAVTCSDADNDPLTLQVTSGPTHGTATVGTGQITYKPAAGFSGTDSLTVAADDGRHGRSATRTITVTVVNHAPVCSDDTRTTTQNTAVTVTLACTDPDGDAVTVTPATVVGGTLTPDGAGASGTRTFTPDTGAFGTKSFGFTATDDDASPLTSPAAKVTVHIDRRPSCAAPAAPVVVQAGVAKHVAIDCTDPDGDPLTYKVITDGAHGSAVPASGGFTYTPADGYAGTDQVTVAAQDGQTGESDPVTVSLIVDRPPVCSVPSGLRADFRAAAGDPGTVVDLGCTDPDGDALTYTASGLADGDALDGLTNPPTFKPTPGSSGNATFTVTAIDAHGLASAAKPVTILVDHPPACSAVPAQSVGKNATTALDVAVTCTDADGDALTLSASTAPAHGTATIAGATVSYTPAHGFSGADQLKVVADDGHHGRSAPQTIAITVVNHRPTCSDADVTGAQDTPVTVTLHCTDPDGDAVKLSTGPITNGSLLEPVNQPGDYTFKPAAGFFGSIAFSFKAVDDDAVPLTSSPGTVTVTVIKADRAPVCAGVKVLTVSKNGSVGFNPDCSDPDGDAITIDVLTDQAHSPKHGDVTAVGAAGPLPFLYKPRAGYTGQDTFTIVATDPKKVSSAPLTVAVTVGPDRAPSCPDRTATVAAGGGVPIALACTDADGDPLTYVLADAPKLGTATLTPAGALSYTAGEAGTDTLTYRAVDDQATASAPATVTITVTPRPPAGGGDNGGTPPGDGEGSRPVSGGGPVVTAPPTPAERAKALLGGDASAFDIGFGTKLKLWTAAGPVAPGAPLAVLLCDSCKLAVDVTLNLSGLPPAKATSSAGAAAAKPRKLVLARQTVKGKGLANPVAVRLKLTSAQRALVRRATKATIALEVAGTVAGRTRHAHRTMRASTTN